MIKPINRNYHSFKYLALTLLTLLLTQPVAAQKQGTIDGEVWTQDQSPNHITGDILVKDLTIEPGVVILFEGNYRFDINGTLRAEGTKSDSIVFKPAPTNSSGWQGISFDTASSSSKVAYCRIEGTNNYSIHFDSSTPTIRKCDIVNNLGDGMIISGGEITLSNCLIKNNVGYGVNVNSGARASFTNSIFSQNGKNGLYINNMGNVQLTNCIVSYNSEDGVILLDSNDSLTVTNSVIAYNSSRGILSFGGMVEIINSIIYKNTLQSAGSDTAQIDYSYFASWMGDYNGIGNINSLTDPQPFSNDTSFTLSPFSPFIDSGNPNAMYNDICFPPSLGTKTNDMGAYGGPMAYKWFDPLYITPKMLYFGNITVDSTAVQQVIIKNYSDNNLSITSTNIRGEDADNFFIETHESLPIPIEPFDSISVDVQFKPVAIGSKNAILTILTDTGNDSITLNGFGVTAEIVTEPSLNFKDTNVGHYLTKEFFIRNGGEDTLRIFNVSNSLPVFSIQNLSASRLIPPLQRDTIYVTFQPDSNLAYLDSLEIVSNDPDNSILYVTLNGSGLAPILEGIPSPLDFGEVLTYSDSMLYFGLTNTGNDTLNIKSEHITGADSAAFTIFKGPGEVVIPPGMPGDTVVIRFAPDSVGAKSALLRVSSNDPFKNPVDFPLAGIGVSPEFVSSPNAINFGRVPVDTSTNFILKILNPGTYNLSIDSIQITGLDSLLFSLSRDISGSTISPDGGPDTIEVTFSPGTQGLKSADLKIYHNDLHHNPSVIPLSGEGVIAPEIHSKPMALDFGTIYISNHQDSSIILYNKGQATLHVDSIKIVDAYMDNFLIKTHIDSDTIAVADDSLKVKISFSPYYAGIQNAMVRVYSDDPLNDSLDIALTGVGKIDETPATIRVDTSQIKLIRDTTFTMKAAIGNDETGIDSTYLFFRQGGKTVYHDTSFTRIADSIWSVTIAGEYVTERGFEYYIETYHGGRTTIYPGDSTDIPLGLLVDIPELGFLESTSSGLYQMISLPVNPLNQTLDSLFEDDLGSYDDREYRIFDYDTAYVELSTMSDTLLPGKALWLITREAKSLALKNCQSVPTDQEYVIPLHQGWNMIGVPFAFPVAWDNIDTSGTVLYTYSGNGWIDTTLMVPFQGYAIESDSEATLKIPAREANPGLGKSTTYTLGGQDWQIQIKAKKESFYDRRNFAGVRTWALFGKDKYDAPEPPVIGKYVSLYFKTADETGKIRHLAKDFRNPNDDFYIFDFCVISNFAGQTRLDFVPQNLPEDLDWIVLSYEGQVRYPKGSITIMNEKKLLRLVVGNQETLTESFNDYLEIPLEFKLAQNFPNPFNPVTNIRFQLPDASRITLEIFDILGRRVKTLLDNKYYETGYHQISWDGRNQNNQDVASGIYLLNFKSKNYNKVIKMVLQR